MPGRALGQCKERWIRTSEPTEIDPPSETWGVSISRAVDNLIELTHV